MFNEAIIDHARETILRARMQMIRVAERGIGGIPPKPKKFLQKMVLFMKALFVIPNFQKIKIKSKFNVYIEISAETLKIY